MTLVVSSNSDSFAPGTFLVQSGASAKASSALQALDTRMPDHDPELVALFLPSHCEGGYRKKHYHRQEEAFRRGISSDRQHQFETFLSFLNPLLLYTRQFRRTRKIFGLNLSGHYDVPSCLVPDKWSPTLPEPRRHHPAEWRLRAK